MTKQMKMTSALGTFSATGIVATAEKPVTKIGQVLVVLKSEDGATLDQLIAVTGWQPHTVRAVLTSLRKKGHVIISARGEGACVYHASNADGGVA